jgi:hypothetical protein
VSQFSGSTFGNYSRVYLIILGVIFLVVGGAVLVFLGGIPFAGGGMVLMGGIFAIVGLVLIGVGVMVGRKAAATNTLLATGVAGTATITGLTQTGMYLNEQPQISMDLMVNIPGRAPYPANHHEFVPLLLIGRLSSGAPLSVRVDPFNPQRLAVDWSGTGFSYSAPLTGTPTQSITMPGAAAAAPQTTGAVDESLSQVQAALASSGMAAATPFATAEQGNYTVEQLRAYLRQSGVPATATIDTLEDSGRVVGDERLFTVEMTLNMPGQAPKKLPKSAAMVPITAAYKVVKGMSVPVRYAAENPDLLMVEWDKI